MRIVICVFYYPVDRIVFTVARKNGMEAGGRLANPSWNTFPRCLQYIAFCFDGVDILHELSLSKILLVTDFERVYLYCNTPLLQKVTSNFGGSGGLTVV